MAIAASRKHDPGCHRTPHVFLLEATSGHFLQWQNRRRSLHSSLTLSIKFEISEEDLLNSGAQLNRKRKDGDGSKQGKKAKSGRESADEKGNNNNGNNDDSNNGNNNDNDNSNDAAIEPSNSTSPAALTLTRNAAAASKYAEFGSYNSQLLTILSSGLPSSISIWHVEEVPLSFDARRSCVAKRYIYTINEGTSCPFGTRFCWDLKLTRRPGSVGLDVEAMQEAANRLVGKHDFAAFSNMLPTDTRDPNQEMFRLQVRRHCCTIPLHYGWNTENASSDTLDYDADGTVCSSCLLSSSNNTNNNNGELEGKKGGGVVTITAICSRYMYKMMRMVSGALCEVGKGILTPDRVEELLRGAVRTKEVRTAPAHGLCLDHVFYQPPRLAPLLPGSGGATSTTASASSSTASTTAQPTTIHVGSSPLT